MKEYKVTINNNGTEQWYLNGQLHRDEGPAVIKKGGEGVIGYEMWYQNGKPHREDGPATTYTNGYQAWYKHGERHREDGPAIVHENGGKSWYLDGKELTKEEFLRKTRKSCNGKIVEIDGKKYRLQEV